MEGESVSHVNTFDGDPVFTGSRVREQIHLDRCLSNGLFARRRIVGEGYWKEIRYHNNVNNNVLLNAEH